MSTIARDREAARKATPSNRINERRFFFGLTVTLAAAVVLGFARTFFLRPWFPEWAGRHGAPEPIFYVHGTLVAGWYLLLVIQAALVACRNVARHRQLGTAGAVLAGAVVAVGIPASLVAARRPTGFIDVAVPPLEFLAVPVLILVLFSVFVTLAFVARRDVQAHKRYMLLASIVMVEAAVGRWPFAFMDGPSPLPLLEVQSLVTALFLVALMAWDVANRRRVHAVTAIGTVAILATQALRGPLATTPLWHAAATFAIRLVGS